MDGALVERLRRVFANRTGFRLAVLFGSAAKGGQRGDSDVDIAVLPRDPDIELSDELDLQVALERACGRCVDLVRLDRASTLLRWQIARHGVPLEATAASEWPRFRAAAAGEHADLAPALAVAARRFRQRLLEAGAAD